MIVVVHSSISWSYGVCFDEIMHVYSHANRVPYIIPKKAAEVFQ